MREGWTYKKFEDCLVKAPKAKQVQTSQYNTGTKYPIVSQEDTLISGYFDDDAYLYHIDNPIVVFGDHTRVLKYLDFDFVVGADGVKILIPKEFLNAKLLYYYLLWYKIPNLGYSRHYKLLKEIDIPIPPLSEQQSIVAELDKINELISLKKAQLSDLDNLAQSIFYDMFGDPIENEKGWEVKKLWEVTEPTIGLTYKPENVMSDGTGTIVLRSSNIQDSKLDFNDIVRVNIHIKENKYVKDGDILMCSRNGSFKLVGKVAMIHSLSERMSYGAFMTIIRSEYNPYLFGYFKTSAFREYLIQGKTTTVNQITVQMLKEIKLPLPPLSLQQEFAKRIELIEQQKAQTSSTIKDLETLLASRMQYWFD